MRSKITTLFILLAITVFSQNENSSDNQSVKMDTIKTFNKVILCKIVEIADENVKFKYPNEDILVSLNKNMIEKISFSSGRTQIFSESTLCDY